MCEYNSTDGILKDKPENKRHLLRYGFADVRRREDLYFELLLGYIDIQHSQNPVTFKAEIAIVSI